MIERIFGWVFAVLGIVGIVGVVSCGALLQWVVFGGSVLMAWCCFSEARKEAQARRK